MMAVPSSQIRDLLGRPQGLPEGTVTEYITMRTNEADVIARTNKYDIATANQVTTAQKEDYIKAAVCTDVLTVLIDTLPMDSIDRKANDTRFKTQLDAFARRAAEMRVDTSWRSLSPLPARQRGRVT